MSRKTNPQHDKEVLEYLKDHSWLETQGHFHISSRSIKLIKDRNHQSEDHDSKVESKVIPPDPKYQNATKRLLSLFMDLTQLSTITTPQWNSAIKKHLDFDLMQVVKEELKL